MRFQEVWTFQIDVTYPSALLHSVGRRSAVGPARACCDLPNYATRVGPLTVKSTTQVLLVNNVPLWPTRPVASASRSRP